VIRERVVARRRRRADDVLVVVVGVVGCSFWGCFC